MTSPRRGIAGPSLPVVFLTVAAVHGVSTMARPTVSVDTVLYAGLADGFLRGDFSGTFNLATVRWTKTVYIAVLAIARLLAPVSWPQLMLVVNIALSATTAVLVVDLTRRFAGGRAAWSALVLFAFSFELAWWVHAITTDVLFTMLAFLAFYLIARRLDDGDRRPRLWAVCLATLAAVFARPPGILLVPLLLFVELVLVRRRISKRTALTALGVIGLAAAVGRAFIVQDPRRWPFAFVREKIIAFSQREQSGEVVLYAQQSLFGIPERIGDYLFITAERFVRFFQPTASWYSPRHNLVNGTYFTVLYALFLVAACGVASPMTRKQRALALVTGTFVAMYAALHALTLLDAQWRYRATVVPHFVLLAAIGVDCWSRRRETDHDVAST